MIVIRDKLKSFKENNPKSAFVCARIASVLPIEITCIAHASHTWTTRADMTRLLISGLLVEKAQNEARYLDFIDGAREELVRTLKANRLLLILSSIEVYTRLIGVPVEFCPYEGVKGLSLFNVRYVEHIPNALLSVGPKMTPIKSHKGFLHTRSDRIQRYYRRTAKHMKIKIDDLLSGGGQPVRSDDPMLYPLSWHDYLKGAFPA